MQTDDPLRKGILPRVAQCIFGSIAEADESVEFLIKLSMVMSNTKSTTSVYVYIAN